MINIFTLFHILIDGFYKKGSENAKLSTLKKLCTYFGCTLDFLANDNFINEPITIATHKEHEYFTDEELLKIEEYKKLLIAARPKE